MPELPEVETTRRGIEPYLADRRIVGVVVRERRLRWPVPAGLERVLRGARVDLLERRGKYILARTSRGSLIVHLGMSGSLRVLTERAPPAPHDHIDIQLPDGVVIRYHDPRRFGCFLWTAEDPLDHPLLRNLGPEPFSDEFGGDYLYRTSRGRRASVKSFIMDARIVVGVGNIYASESLAMAGVHPLRAAGRVSRQRYATLADAIRRTLARSIELGGTTLRDFVNPGGAPGYFEQSLRVYGRAGKPCRVCASPLRQVVVGQRSTFYCPRCQR
ncbi:MAG: bifunctional DNA-formamidopyrimidine glycosylase/DNA-(apurinic or apyrimidinic site) lyase [Proteobacteria bacterium]|nr:MAG: bifunctional DNA-formamidopyrimidine glycosylase/DNA-(apurinic or apyrimidinic site) lyase [Pseudomonadota bacterium]